MNAPVQLLVYRFGADAGYEGRLVGALERIESGGALRVLDALFVGQDAESGEQFAIDVHGTGGGGMVAPLLGFRLNLDERRRRSRKAAGGDYGELIAALGETLGPGEALVAVLVEHEWARALEDAVARTGGSGLANAYVEGKSFTDLGPVLVDVAKRASAPPE